MGKTIGILSLKGGVGKTSIVSALGAALADFNKKILLVDANFSAPNLGVHLNIFDPKATIHDVLERVANPKDAVHSLFNFDVIPASVLGKRGLNYLKLKDRIKSLKRNYDMVLLDGSPSLNEETLAVMNASDELLIVTTPDNPTLGMTLKAIKLAKQRGAPVAGLILNKVYNKKFELPLEHIEETAEVPVLAVIPYDINMLKSVANFTPSTLYKPNSKGSDEFKRLASSLLGEAYSPVKLRSFFKWINPQRQDINRTVYYKRLFN